MQVVLEKASVCVGTIQELPPAGSVTCEACQFEAGEAFRGQRVRCPFNRRNALEGNVAELRAHVREAFRLPVEIED